MVASLSRALWIGFAAFHATLAAGVEPFEVMAKLHEQEESMDEPGDDGGDRQVDVAPDGEIGSFSDSGASGRQRIMRSEASSGSQTASKLARALRMQAQLKADENFEDGLRNSNTSALLASYRSAIADEKLDLDVGQRTLTALGDLCGDQIKIAEDRIALVNQVLAHLKGNASISNGGFASIRERFRKLVAVDRSNRWYVNSSIDKIQQWKLAFDKDESNDEAVRTALVNSDGK